MAWKHLRISRFGGPEVLQVVEQSAMQAGAIQPEVIERLPLAAAGEVHARIDKGGLGGKIVLLPWAA